jgi:hypothetical protein
MVDNTIKIISQYFQVAPYADSEGLCLKTLAALRKPTSLMERMLNGVCALF